MAIYKAKLSAKYAMIPNSSLQDSSLSYEATGLLAMMLSLPSDWEIRKSWLQGQKQKCGRDKLTAMMNELIQNGYVRKEVKQDDSGRFNGVDWFVYPESAVELESRSTVNPLDGESDTTNKTSLKKETAYKKNATPPPKKPKATPIDYSVLQMTDEQVEEVKRIRKQTKGVNSQRAINQLAKECDLSRRRGFSNDDILNEWTTRGWRSYKDEWNRSKPSVKVEVAPNKPTKRPSLDDEIRELMESGL